jgi:hypothetical protein
MRTVRTVERALALLRMIAVSPEPVTFGQLHRGDEPGRPWTKFGPIVVPTAHWSSAVSRVSAILRWPAASGWSPSEARSEVSFLVPEVPLNGVKMST